MERGDKGPREKATLLLRILGDACPSSLRSPLRAVRDGTEVVGTAEDILQIAIDVVNRMPART